MTEAQESSDPQKRSNTSDSLSSTEPNVRMVLIGKTGVGKSASGNTILGRKAFESRLCPQSITTKCQKEEAEVEGQTLVVVDTPDLLDANKSKDMKEEMDRCISLSAPGPHVFLAVIPSGRFKKQDNEVMKIIRKLFGKQAPQYTMVLFSRGDVLKEDSISVEEFIGQNPSLQTFISQCGGGYHVLNNRKIDPSQVRELLQKINMMVQRNGGGCYNSNQPESKNWLTDHLPAVAAALALVAIGLITFKLCKRLYVHRHTTLTHIKAVMKWVLNM